MDDVVELAMELAFDEPAHREHSLGGLGRRPILLDFRASRPREANGLHAADEASDDTLAATLAAFLHLTREAEVKTAVVVPIGRHQSTLRRLPGQTSTVGVFEDEGDALAWLAS